MTLQSPRVIVRRAAVAACTLLAACADSTTTAPVGNVAGQTGARYSYTPNYDTVRTTRSAVANFYATKTFVSERFFVCKQFVDAPVGVTASISVLVTDLVTVGRTKTFDFQLAHDECLDFGATGGAGLRYTVTEAPLAGYRTQYRTTTYDQPPIGSTTVTVTNFGPVAGLSDTISAHGTRPGTTYTRGATFEFINTRLFSVGDRVWDDANKDGVQDPGEAGINGVTVSLRNSSDVEIATATTSGDGNYTFPDLLKGDYKVCTTAGVPSGYTQTYDLDGTATANCASFTLTADRTDVDFGYTPPRYALGDRVWNDTNRDGVQDPAEVGLVGVTLTLYDATNAVLGTTVTVANGIYGFGDLLAGSYKVCVTGGLPSGFVQTYDLDGTATANCASVTLTADRTDVDFGYTPTYSIGDRVWEDANGNTAQDLGEPGLNNVTVSLYTADAARTLLGTKVTTGDGNYLFSGLFAGTYEVCVTSGVPSGYTQTYDYTAPTTDNCAMATVGPSTVLIDFGYKAPVVVGGFGCSPGYWKNHNFPAGYNKTDLFTVRFAPTTRFAGKTMQQVLSTGGGGLIALGRHAVSAYFNAIALGTKYEYTPAQVVTMFNAATTSAQIDALITTFSSLEDVNGRSCPNPTGR